MKKFKWRIRRLRRAIDRIYKGYSDLFGVLFVILGALITPIGWWMLLLGDYKTIVVLYVGFSFLYVGTECFKYGRLK